MNTPQTHNNIFYIIVKFNILDLKKWKIQACQARRTGVAPDRPKNGAVATLAPMVVK
jgi:hypothetical protein